MRSKKDLELTVGVVRIAIFILCILFYFSQVPGGSSSEVTVGKAKSYFPETINKKIDTFLAKEGTKGGVKIQGNDKIINKDKLIQYFKDEGIAVNQYSPFYNYKALFNIGAFTLVYVIVALFITNSAYHPFMSLIFSGIDFLLCTLFIFFTGGIKGPFIFLYFLPTANIAAHLGSTPGLCMAIFTVFITYIFSAFLGFTGVEPIKTFESMLKGLFPMGVVLALTGYLIGYISNITSPITSERHIVIDDTKKKLDDLTKRYQDQSKLILKYQDMEQQLRSKQREVTDINEIIKEIVSEVNIRKLFPLIVTKAAEQCEARVGALLMKTNQGELKVEERYNLSPISEKIFFSRVGEGVPGTVALTGKPLKLSKEDNDPAFSFFARCPERIQNCLCVPMSHMDEIRGVIILCNKLTGTSFSNDDVMSLTNIAGIASTAIANAALFKELEKTNKELEDANRMLELKNIELRKSIEDTITTLAEALDAKDTYTRGHTERVAKYALCLAEHMHLPDKEIERIRRGSLLHDIGKIGIPDRILLKPEGLTDEEFEIIKTHVTEGAKIINKVDSLKDLIDVVKYHHEKFDGSGYPLGLKGEKIPIAARIVSVADTYDAMTTDRPYRKGFLPEVAIEKMAKFAPKQFGMDVFAEFEKMLKRKSFFRS